eukprot:754892-Hanusia_phi.AAC.2
MEEERARIVEDNVWNLRGECLDHVRDKESFRSLQCTCQSCSLTAQPASRAPAPYEGTQRLRTPQAPLLPET